MSKVSLYIKFRKQEKIIRNHNKK